MSHLSPKDLVNLTRTSKLLRETLAARNATAVWKSARKRVGFPDCPPDFSEFKWASLFFGTKCQVRSLAFALRIYLWINRQGCGAPNVLNIDFRIRRRVCISCKKGKSVLFTSDGHIAAQSLDILSLVVKSRFPVVFPDFDPVILDLIPYTNGKNPTPHYALYTASDLLW